MYSGQFYKEETSHLIGDRSGLYVCGVNADVPAPVLADEIDQALCADSRVVLKEDRRTKVVLTTLHGRRVVIKQYRLTRRREWIKYCFQISPARRYWGSARTMQRQGLPTATPLFCLEKRRFGIPVESCIITEYVASFSGRTWIEQSFPSMPSAFRSRFVADLWASVAAFYENGIYHKDMKLENLLLLYPEKEEKRLFLWIDLECVQCGRRISRHDVIRNMVQLNGAAGMSVPNRERFAFLRRVAGRYPWIADRKVLRRMANWTKKRLDKERLEQI